MKIAKPWLLKHTELFFWLTALVILFFMDTESNGLSFCLFKSAGLSWCPGCGIGHAIHAALHLQLGASLQYHPFGIVAVLVILYRIKQLSVPLKQVTI